MTAVNPAGAIAAGLALVFLCVVGYAKAAGAWHGAVPEQVFSELIPRVSTLGHP